jgi:glutamine amidotransferase
MIVVVDYGMGNLRSVTKALEHVSDEQVLVSRNANEILAADRVVFPGQGAARDCMKELQKHQLVDVIRTAAASKPFLGICMGMQVLMQHSEENEGIDCLGWYQGQVNAFKNNIPTQQTVNDQQSVLKIPQMGWNKIEHKNAHPLWQGIESGARFYFVHSYYVAPKDSALITGQTNYGIDYASAIAKDNIFAIQAHPEKSAKDGLQLLKNFTQWDGQWDGAKENIQ